MRRRPNPDSEPNIRRIDTKPRAAKQTHGFQVHLLRGTEAVSKMFSDSVYGGKEGARRAARKFRKTALGTAPERRPTGLLSEAQVKKQKGSKSGSRSAATKRRKAK
jgi:hypothetical protein